MRLKSIILGVILILALLVHDVSLILKARSGNPGVTSQEIWHDGYTVLTRIDDGGCRLYVVRGKVNSLDAAPVAMVITHTCSNW